MRILLINPWPGEVFPPPSVGYLQSALKHWKVDVTAMDLNEALSTNEEFDLVGVSFHSFSVRYARQIRDKFKCRLICGGHHPSSLPEQMLSIGYDQVVVGEGENAILDIIEGNEGRIINSKDVECYYFYGIDELPFPDYSSLRFDGSMGIPIISSRGCPFHCNFCASSDFWGHRTKLRKADNVLREIEHWIAKGFNTWMFEDDNFTLNRERTFEICGSLEGNYTWQCASRADVLDKELCTELYRAGCRVVWLGIESLSQESLDRCNKHTKVEKMIAGIKTAENIGISTRCQLIAGLPGDTIRNIQETQNNLHKHKIQAGYNIAWILPGTEIYQQAKQRGFKDEQFLETGAPYYTYEQDINTLINWSKMI